MPLKSTRRLKPKYDIPFFSSEDYILKFDLGTALPEFGLEQGLSS
jgi:hypothetical protein